MMAGVIPLILIGLLCGVRTQRSLVFENLALRHQLAVLQRTTPRPRLGTADRLFWVLLSRLWSGWLYGCRLRRPTRDRDPVASGPASSSSGPGRTPERTRPPGRRPGGSRAHPTDVHGESPLGRAADSRGASETGRPDLAGGGLQVRRPPSEAAIADLANLSREPPGGSRLRGLLCRTHRDV